MLKQVSVDSIDVHLPLENLHNALIAMHAFQLYALLQIVYCLI